MTSGSCVGQWSTFFSVICPARWRILIKILRRSMYYFVHECATRCLFLRGDIGENMSFQESCPTLLSHGSHTPSIRPAVSADVAPPYAARAAFQKCDSSRPGLELRRSWRHESNITISKRSATFHRVHFGVCSRKSQVSFDERDI